MTDHLTPFFEIKRATSEGVFSGYASTFGPPADTYGDIIAQGAFTKALEQHERNKTMPALLWGHDTDQPIGVWTSFKADDYGLLATGKLSLGVERAREALALLRDGAVSLSIGFRLARNGATTKDGIRTIHNIALLQEVSIVAIPANAKAKVVDVKRSPRDFEKALREKLGLSQREAKRACSGGYGALVRDERQSEMQTVLDRIDQLQSIIETRMR